MKRRRMIAAAIIGVSVLLLIYMLIEPHWLRVHRIELADPDIPEAFDGVTIAFFADIHQGPRFSVRRVERLVDRVNSLNPDIVLMGGDYVHRSRTDVEPCFEALSRLQAPMGVYGVLGNHDHWEGAEAARQAMAEAGIALLDNRAEWVTKDGDRIRIGGVGDLWEDRQDIAATIGATSEDDFAILVSHNPDYVEQITTRKVDWVLAGHTHGGEITLFGLWAPWVPSRYGNKYRAGVVETEYTKVFVTTGAASPHLVRFFCRPEIVLVTLRRT